jgi:glutamate-ammonia-ligase adenylyltransferase
MQSADAITAALGRAWHQQSAQSSLDRWFDICRKEGWGDIPEKLPLLISVFGASWFFTRYIFYRGREAALLLDNAEVKDLGADIFSDKFRSIEAIPDQEQQLERLRLLKNGFMLQILACQLSGKLEQPDTERYLTQLAVASLSAVMEIFTMHSRADSRIAVYGMGRIAGEEMTYGSDLDLIFVYDNPAMEESHQLSRKVRMLMRYIAVAGSAGSLYEVDMRLRPHGTSGALLTPAAAFMEYHLSDCEIWERQMMTRCRPVYDPHGLGRECLDRITPSIYAEHDWGRLRREIAGMRKRVQEEKGEVSGKFEVKRGPGGIMDIDFLTHYLQLCHGAGCPELRTCSTRNALKVLAGRNYLDPATALELSSAYDFLKRIEASIRLFDMKPISAFPVRTAEHLPVAAAMGYAGDNASEFAEKYKDITAGVRSAFREIVGEA